MVFLGSIGGEGTITIAICFIFLAYLLHPVVETAYHRIRAYFAWRAIEDNQFVEVTDYPIVAEVVWGRGKMDAARLVAFALLLFSIASWGLELCLGVVSITDGQVDMFDRPPPVMFVDGDKGPWEVARRGFFVKEIPQKEGTLGNFHPRGDTGSDYTLQSGQATSVYRTRDNQDSPLEGVIVIAFWSNHVNDSNAVLYYDIRGDTGTGNASVDSLTCNGDVSPEDLYIREEGKWGEVTTCERGPTPTDGAGPNRPPPPTIILNSSSDPVHLIVEEVGSYPGFLYSVWSAKRSDIEPVIITHEFHIGSRFRLVEAIITGIVLGYQNGGSCVDVMLQFSKSNASYAEDFNKTRTQPFGESPGNNRGVDNLEEVEPIPRGVDADGIATSCLVLLGIMSFIGIIWSWFLRSNIGMDVYDRDELIKAVTLTDQNGEARRSASLRMFVRKDETGRIDVIISDTGRNEGFCGAFFKKPGVVAQEEPAVAAAVVESSDNNPIPTGPTQIRLEGMRMGLGRTNFPRGFGPRSYSLTSSPIPSAMCTPMNRTPARTRDRDMNEIESWATVEGRKALEMPESVGDSARTLPMDRSGYTANLPISGLRGRRSEGTLPPLPSTTEVPPSQAGTSSTTFASRPSRPYQRRLGFSPSLVNMPSESNSTEASPEDSDSDTTLSSANNG